MGQAVFNVIKRIRDGISRVFVGNDWAVQVLLATLLAEGHALLLGPIGSGKTTLARSLAIAIGGTFKRVQMTNETLPSDIIGFAIYTPTGESKLVRGPIFANVVLLDEMNRASPRALSALLEAMQERQVTIDGVPLELPKPHMVIATMNITEVEIGYTQQLPLAVIDRFMTSIYVGYVGDEEEPIVVGGIDKIESELVSAMSTVRIDDVMGIIGTVRNVYVDGSVLNYMMGIVRELRRDPRLLVPLSTRAPIAIFKLSRALALLNGRDYVLPDDIKAATYPTLMHRIVIRPEYRGSVTVVDVINEVLDKVPVPHYVTSNV